jgi:hypothetical protein
VEGEGIPAKYSDEAKTPLLVEVQKDGHTIDVKLE